MRKRPASCPKKNTAASLRALLEQSGGNTILEFALVVPLFLLFVMGICEMGLILYASTVLEATMSNDSGEYPTGAACEGYLRNRILSRGSPLLQAGNLNIQRGYVSGFLRSTPPITCHQPICVANTSGVGAGTGNLVYYTATYTWNVVTPLLRPLIGDQSGHVVLSAATAINDSPL